MADFSQPIKILEAARDSAIEASKFMHDEKKANVSEGIQICNRIAENDVKIANYEASIEKLKEASDYE